MAGSLRQLVDSGRIADEAALKRAFRTLAKSLHPDLAGGGATGTRAFVALRRDYEESLAVLASGPGRPLGSAEPAPASRPAQAIPYSPRAFYESFQDLLARGFPRVPSSPRARRLYDASREEVLGLLLGRGGSEGPRERACLDTFLAFEGSFSRLAEEAPEALRRPPRPAYELKNLLFNIVDYHTLGFSHLARYARNEGPRLKAELLARGEGGGLGFLDLLLADLEAGPACPEA